MRQHLHTVHRLSRAQSARLIPYTKFSRLEQVLHDAPLLEQEFIDGEETPDTQEEFEVTHSPL
jgi:hypothetical protein